MSIQESINFKRIQDAIEYINVNFKEQPSLEEIAQHIHLSPAHFQRLFTEWAGVSPKKYLQYISIEYAKDILGKNSLVNTAYETGLSGSSRLHDLFINIEGMTPLEYRNGGENLSINYSFRESPFGDILVASTSKGVCHMSFSDNPTNALNILQSKFPNATYNQKTDTIQLSAIKIFSLDWDNLSEIKLHLKGTDFQLKVWEALLDIPFGQLTTYGDIASKVNSPNASRAVGTAIGDNPIAYLIPCHRVIRSSGELGGYRWGLTRKTAMIGWEAAQTSTSESE